VNNRHNADTHGAPAGPPPTAESDDLPVGKGAAALLRQIAELTDGYEDVLDALERVSPQLAAKTRASVEQARLTLATYQDPAPYPGRHTSTEHGPQSAAW
jgi:hypothetical protein